MSRIEGYEQSLRVFISDRRIKSHATHDNKRLRATQNICREASLTGEVFVLLDGQFDDVVRVLKDPGAVFQSAVVETNVVDGE